MSQHNKLAVILVDMEEAMTPADLYARLLLYFDKESPVCLGPLRHGIHGAVDTIQAALNTYTVAPAAKGLSVGRRSCPGPSMPTTSYPSVP